MTGPTFLCKKVARAGLRFTPVHYVADHGLKLLSPPRRAPPFLVLCGAGSRAQSFMYARQTLYPLSHIPHLNQLAYQKTPSNSLIWMRFRIWESPTFCVCELYFIVCNIDEETGSEKAVLSTSGRVVLPGEVGSLSPGWSTIHLKARSCEYKAGTFRALANHGFLFSELNTWLEMPVCQEASISCHPCF